MARISKKQPASPKEKKTRDTIMAEELRARANKLSDAERKLLMAHAMRAIWH